MKIWLSEAGKRFNRDWIFRRLSYTFHTGTSYAITGPNGSGKSTLLQVLAGSLNQSEGKIEWSLDNKSIDPENIFKVIAICAPYLEVIEEMTGLEFFNFHRRFKALITNISPEEIIKIINLQASSHKQIRYYSSGMKQRIKLAQAIFSDTPVVLLDEPCTNLDGNGYELYYQLIEKFCSDKIVVVSSNDEKEYTFCKQKISMNDWKQDQR